MSQEEKEKEQEQNIAPETNEEPKVDSEHAKHERKRRHERHRDESAQKVQEMGEKLAEMNDKYVRLYSEYENYRKRTNMEKADLIMNGGKEMIKAVLPVVDDMERALQAMDDSEGAKEGITLIYNKLMTILSQKGLKPIEAKGQKFDENLHEAVTQFPATEESQKGCVVDVVEKGYYLNEKVLRYAKVVVAI
ncbi:MAG: nucleotide exchange factor GrpE [Bacteroidales bacterium]|nr:nucleotide exchange factor GrpE [Bacteroidales bacterium]MBR3434589.1 nucleotide exchange factor GrpE [Bacteroidales bacterium]